MLKIRLQRTGRKNAPTYRIVVAEHSRPVQGKYIEILGYYLPTRNPAEFEVDTSKVEAWIKKGAQPTDTLARLLKGNGMKDMESYISSYTKKRKKNAPEEEEAPPPPPPAAEAESAKEEAEVPAEEPTTEPEPEAPAEEKPADEPKEEASDKEPAKESTEEPKEDSAESEEKKD